ncbi:MAG: hypothetical protein FWF26_04000, partial [Treponema sp.]|nr:hypothetical protein [Treponema sp.]
MMQISTPTQALDSPSGGAPPQESGFFGSVHSDSSGFWHGKAQKKDKLGIFAKLLDGLAVKNTKGKEKAENTAEALKLKKPGENAGKSGEKAVNAAKVGEAAVKSARFDPKPENNNQTARHNAKTTPGSELLNNGAFHGELSAFSGFGFNPN